jgi:hypothetical protein
MPNQEQLETHLTDLQRQTKKLFNRIGIDPLHLFHLVVFCAAEQAFAMIFEDMEEVDTEDYLEFKNLLMNEMERAFLDATTHEKRKRRII